MLLKHIQPVVKHNKLKTDHFSFKVMRRSYVTILETLIALSLLACLLAIVFGFFREISLMSQLTEQKQKESFQMRYAEVRLTSIFDHLANERHTSRQFFFYTQPSNYEFSSFTSLIFTFDNGVRVDPMFSGDILARLYLEKSEENRGSEDTYQLALAMWPLYIDHPQDYMQKEILLDHIKSLSFEFYAAPERLKDDNTIQSKPVTSKAVANLKSVVIGDDQNEVPQPEIVLERNVWHEDEWLLGYNQMPSLMKIHLERVEPINVLEKVKSKNSITQVYTFSFVMPSSKNPVYFSAEVK